MKIAVCACDTSRLDSAQEYFRKWRRRGALIEGDYFLSPEKFIKAIEEKNYDVLAVYAEFDWFTKDSVLWQLKHRERESNIIFILGKKQLRLNPFGVKYMAEFNGQPRVMDTEDICFLESYDRKTSVVIGKKKIRIKARLDIEEQKFSDYQFARINQYNLVNMQHIRNIEGDEIYMSNGDNLFIGGSRKKLFKEKFSLFARENFRLL